MTLFTVPIIWVILYVLRLSDALRADAAAGRRRQVLSRLDDALPEVPASATLIEIARELMELERSIAIAQDVGVPAAVTTRLIDEANAAKDALWQRAERISAAAKIGLGTSAIQAALDREDEQLLALHGAIRDSRTALAELTLSGGTGEDAYRRAEFRFKALADTARAVDAWERGEPS
jgi:hypothetical protein